MWAHHINTQINLYVRAIRMHSTTLYIQWKNETKRANAQHSKEHVLWWWRRKKKTQHTIQHKKQREKLQQQQQCIQCKKNIQHKKIKTKQMRHDKRIKKEKYKKTVITKRSWETEPFNTHFYKMYQEPGLGLCKNKKK